MKALRTAAHLAAGALAFLVLLHLFSVDWFLARQPDAFTAVSHRLSNPFWRFVDLVTFLVAIAYGALALFLLVRGRVAHPTWRPAAEAFVLTCAAFLALAVLYAYLTLPLYPRNPLLGGP